MKTPGSGPPANAGEGGEKKRVINPELWQTCAGPLVNLPAAGTHVVYFPQGHSEQVAASMKKDVDAQIPNYSNLQSKLLCILHNVTLHADPETDEVYAQMTLQPVPSFDKEALLRSDLSTRVNRPPTQFFCKTLTASDTSTHGGFSVPRRAAEKIFPPLDFSMQPPAQELTARDLHDTVWTFRHIYRGQPKRHLLTTGWSLFVSGKRLFAGDSVLFIRDENQQLLLGIRRANRQPTNLSSSVLSSDSMHIGILAAAAHAAANNSPFTVFYNPRASPSEFVIPLARYYKAVCSNQISLGMRFRMMFETEESGTRRYMGTITGISDLDPVRWKNSQWRNLQVGWDESAAGERRNRVSIWEIEPVTAPFFICPTPPFYRPKRPRQPGMTDDESADLENVFKRTMPWLGEDVSTKDPGLSLVQWMNMQQGSSLANPVQPNYMNQNYGAPDLSRQLSFSAPQNGLQPNSQRSMAQFDQFQKLPPPAAMNPLASMVQPLPQLTDQSQTMRQNLISQALPVSQVQSVVQPHSGLQQPQRNLQPQQLMAAVSQSQQKNLLPPQFSDQHIGQPLQMPDGQIPLHLLQKFQQQQQHHHQPPPPPLLSQQSTPPPQDEQKLRSDGCQSFSRSMSACQMTEIPPPQATFTSPPRQMPRNNSQAELRFSNVPQQVKLHRSRQEFSGTPAHQPSANGTGLLTGGGAAGGGGQSGITDDVPSCSTSPSTNNSPNVVPSTINGRSYWTTDETMNAANGNFVRDLQPPPKMPPINVSRSQNQGLAAPPTYLHNVVGAQMDYLDSSSSATSVDVPPPHHHHNSDQPPFGSQQMHLKHEVQDVPRTTDISFGNTIDMAAMIPDPLMGSGGSGVLLGYDNAAKDVQPELSSSMVSQSFGVPDLTFNPIDSAMNDGSLLNGGVWAAPPPPPPQFQRMRTYTKVYKRGAVGRSIDISAYSGYEELKQDLARRFGIEGQLEDRQRVGWKLVYVDHENDVLLVGDDPWEEFVNCVRCIKILSPQEVQQLSLDGDFGGTTVLPNQAASSSDGGNV